MDYFDDFDDIEYIGGGPAGPHDGGGPRVQRTQRRRANLMDEMSDAEFRRTFRFSKDFPLRIL